MRNNTSIVFPVLSSNLELASRVVRAEDSRQRSRGLVSRHRILNFVLISNLPIKICLTLNSLQRLIIGNRKLNILSPVNELFCKTEPFPETIGKKLTIKDVCVLQNIEWPYLGRYNYYAKQFFLHSTEKPSRSKYYRDNLSVTKVISPQIRTNLFYYTDPCLSVIQLLADVAAEKLQLF